MQLLDEVRELRSDEAHVEAEHLSVAQRVLEIEIERSKPRPAKAKRRRRIGWGVGLGVGGIGAAALGTFAVLSIVAGSVVAPPTTSTAAAAEVLERASEAALAQVGAVDAQLAPGQYLRVETVMDQVHTDGTAQDLPAETGAFRRHTVEVLYVPADRTQDWIVETRSDEITGVYGPDGQAFLESVLAEPQFDEASVTAYPAGVRTYGEETQTIDQYRDQYDEMPRDPDALLAWFESQTPGGYAGLAILNALHQNLPPADLRAALLGALSRLPEISLVAEDGDLATIERNNAGGDQQFVVDTRTGMLVSVIDPQRHPNAIVPDGLPDGVQTFTTSIVDSAPTPTR
ncbi:MAG: hypothetical protein K0R99_628 [Microbacterium sp.]|jgi:hypothetical protein|uniref:hypothetical protein n=1 Tax=Microbacterium sp. TaxID=51671 RepID=UPI00262D4DCC|nr:hypothetical protein [Microbacterium sp.]MDF2559182.1 hypothetical protein [Microbacterium sp.]